MAISSLSSHSLKALSIPVAFIATFVVVLNPILDNLIAPLEVPIRAPYNPNVTDIYDLKNLEFTKKAEIHETKLDISFLLEDHLPRWMLHLINNYQDYLNMNGYKQKCSIDIFDARKSEELGSFHESGFTLIDMKDSSSIKQVKDWSDEQQVKPFEEELTPHLRELYPEATRFVFHTRGLGGGVSVGSVKREQQIVHLDYLQNDTLRHSFHEEKGVGELLYKESTDMMLGKYDTEEDELKTMVGIWKPVEGAPICVHPLALIDARTFRQEHEIPKFLELNLGFAKNPLIYAGVDCKKQHKWYYYPFQKETEVLLYSIYNKDKYFVNPHAPFENPNCPDFSQSRVTIEIRVGIYMKK